MAYEFSNQPEEQQQRILSSSPTSTSTTGSVIVARPPLPLQFGFFPRSVGVVNPNFCYLDSSRIPLTGFCLERAQLILTDEQSTHSLLQFMAYEGLFPTPEDELKRKDAIDKLKQTILTWIKKIAFQRQRAEVQTSATILTYGSYGLGAHMSDSDIDALCVVPSFATMAEDFFVVLSSMLQERPEVSELHCIKEAKVPLMRFKFSGISVDLPYARLNMSSVPGNVDLLDPLILGDLDDISWRSSSGVRANILILQIVPNVEVFQCVLRCIKLWAKRRGVYSKLVGFFGGIHIVVLTAYVCESHPYGSIPFLISTFFDTFAHWVWPTPVILERGLPSKVADFHCYMPIQLPCSGGECCHPNMTRSTFEKIRLEFQRGFNATRDYQSPGFHWGILFEPFPYPRVYMRFVRILLTSSTQDSLSNWVGWVKSRFRSLLFKLEDVQVICDPNPTEYIEPAVETPNKVFYWGLQRRTSFVNAGSIEKYFTRHLTTGYQGTVGELKLTIVNSSELPKNAQFQSGSAWSKAASGDGGGGVFFFRRPVFSSCCPRYAASGDGGGGCPAVDG